MQCINVVICKAILLYVLLCVYMYIVMYIVNRDFHGNLLSFTLFFSTYNEFCCFSYIYMFKIKQKISQSVYICPNMVCSSYQHAFFFNEQKTSDCENVSCWTSVSFQVQRSSYHHHGAGEQRYSLPRQVCGEQQ